MSFQGFELLTSFSLTVVSHLQGLYDFTEGNFANIIFLSFFYSVR